MRKTAVGLTGSHFHDALMATVYSNLVRLLAVEFFYWDNSRMNRAKTFVVCCLSIASHQLMYFISYVRASEIKLFYLSFHPNVSDYVTFGYMLSRNRLSVVCCL